MNQTIDATQIDEGAEVFDAAHDAFHFDTRLKFLQLLLFLLFPLSFQDGPAAENQVASTGTRFGHDTSEFLVDKLTRVLDPILADLTDRNEAFDAANFFEKVWETGSYLVFSASPVTDDDGNVLGAVEMFEDMTEHRHEAENFDIMERIARAEWDTLLFFYGVIMCVAGLSEFGYMALISEFMYTGLGPTIANSMVGVLSAIVDNIPVMFAVLTMDPDMSLGQWQLVTLTAGTGGSMLAIGSAAGVALLGTARGVYTFGSHLKWTPVIAIGYVLSIFCHLWLNASVI